jgi:hypothetical protein
MATDAGSRCGGLGRRAAVIEAKHPLRSVSRRGIDPRSRSRWPPRGSRKRGTASLRSQDAAQPISRTYTAKPGPKENP